MAAIHGHDAPRGAGTRRDALFPPRWIRETKLDNRELIRTPHAIFPALERRLPQAHGHFWVAWLQAIHDTFPGCTFREAVRGEPALFPTCLHGMETTSSMQDYLELRNSTEIVVREAHVAAQRSLVLQDYLELRNNTKIVVREERKQDKSCGGSRVAQLDAFRACRFREGFASEGMLYNEPPIPLQVLDLLEAQDILNLSLVCKGTHQAAHVLFKREEAVAARRNPCGQADARLAKLLRGIRLGSLLYGTPEAIPVEGRVTWTQALGFEVDALLPCTKLMMKEAARVLTMKEGHITEDVYVLEPRQLRELQEQFRVFLSAEEHIAPDRLRAAEEMLSLVDAANKNGDTVLLRDTSLAVALHLLMAQRNHFRRGNF